MPKHGCQFSDVDIVFGHDGCIGMSQIVPVKIFRHAKFLLQFFERFCITVSGVRTSVFLMPYRNIICIKVHGCFSLFPTYPVYQDFIQNKARYRMVRTPFLDFVGIRHDVISPFFKADASTGRPSCAFR